MDNPREAVLEDVLARILEEQGIETMVLDWKIMDDIVEAENSFTSKHDQAITRASERRNKLNGLLSGKVPLATHKGLVVGSIKRRLRAEKRLIKKARRGRSKDKKRGFTPFAKPFGLRGRLAGVGLAQDKMGQFFVHTHRARCKSYPSPEKIPLSKVRFIRSTG